MESAGPNQMKWRLVIHGGAGVIERGRIAPEEEGAIRAALNRALDAGTAVLRPATAEGLASGILDVLADRAAFAHLGVAARARVASDYSREAFRRKLLAAYASIAPGVRSSVATSM